MTTGSKILLKQYLIADFSKKIILAKTRSKTYNNKLLAIIKTFKTLQYYLKDYKHEVFIFMNYKNLY